MQRAEYRPGDALAAALGAYTAPYILPALRCGWQPWLLMEKRRPWVSELILKKGHR